MIGSGEEASAGGIEPPAVAARIETARVVRVWDPAVRLFHWSLVVAFIIAWFTGDELQRVHETAGYAIMVLLAFRVIWGFIGTAHARFSDFIYRPAVVFAYTLDSIRLRARRYIGHNPAGGAMVVALLATLALTCATGFMMTTDAFWGIEWVEKTHKLAANLAVVLIGLHLVGVATASVQHRENLVLAMITGRKRRQ
jgi:cytochrome b